MNRIFARRALLASLLLLEGCGGATPAPTAPASGSGPSGPSASTPASTAPVADTRTREEAHALVMRAAGCWFGGEWADALGEEDSTKESAVKARCRDLESRVWGGATDKTHYEQLRALEMNAVADVIAKVDETARNDVVDGARRDALVKLTTALAEEQRELMAARRAADRVKRDLDHEPEKLTTDEVDAVVPLRANAKLEALLSFNEDGLGKEANALGLLCALDRVELARGLPKHLKLYAVADELHFLFGVNVPSVPRDATTKLVPGTWLEFLSEASAAAGYPVGRDAKTPRERDALAWAGMLEGFSDKLKSDADAIGATTPLRQVVTVALHRLEAEYQAQQNAEATKHPAALR
ncbi:MAG TPA: hypothetical protein VEK07_19370 [Polyangiaceae bacterium]|nr:hypothetical protein [Polyangiaceae bacterium]